DLKMPRVLAVLTHIDLLPPAMDWTPPYAWHAPKRPKEISIRDALATVREQLGDLLTSVVPVCTAPERLHRIQEELLPALAEQLREARAVALVRCLTAEADQGKVTKVVGQLLAAGGQAAKLWLESRKGRQ